MKNVTIYTDGGCNPNPGPGGLAAVFVLNGGRKEIARGFRYSTNNRMELRAAIVALETLSSPCTIALYSDSLYLVQAMRNGWVTNWRSRDWRLASKKRASNVDLWERLLELCEHHTVDFRWVRGHADDPENCRCDQLAAEARKGALEEDVGYESGFQGF